MNNTVLWIVRFLVKLLVNLKVDGIENIPPTGGFVIATNHLGFLDAPMAYYAIDRHDLFIPVAEKWEKNPLLRFLGRNLNFIFVDRFNPDLKAMREMIRRMEAGQALVIAPEGTRSRIEQLAEGKPGVAYLAAKSGFPIIPVALVGTEDRIFKDNLKHFRRTNVKAAAGKPFKLPPLPKENRDETLHQYTDEIMCQIAALLPEKYRGVYADHPRLKELLAQGS